MEFNGVDYGYFSVDSFHVISEEDLAGSKIDSRTFLLYLYNLQSIGSS